MDTIRITCGAMIDLRVHGRFALIGSRTHFQRTGERVLSPFGGGIDTTEQGHAQLMSQFDIDPASFEEKNGLRFRLPCADLDRFRTWFNEEAALEPDPAKREFMEETGSYEHDLLPPDLAAQASFVFARQVEGVQLSSRRGQEGVLTHYFLRYYKTDAPEELLQTLFRLSQQATNLLEFVTAKEIAVRQSARRSTIRDLCQFLV